MARPIRIEYAGALYHVTSRGDRREDIYLDDEDRLIRFTTDFGWVKKQIFLGDEQFVDKAITQIDIVDGSLDLREVPRMQRRKQAKSLSGYEEHFSLRNDAIVNVYVSGDYLMKAIADRFKLHYSIVSRVIRKAEDA